jgi:hypothetical protein
MLRLKRAFRGRTLGSLCGVLGLVSTALLSSCTSQPAPSATINYKEVSVCTGDNGGAGPDFQILLVFEITSISNMRSNATSFDFKPDVLYVNGQNGYDYAKASCPGPDNSNPLKLATAPFGFAHAQTVPAGSTAPVNSGVVVIDTVDPGGSDISNANTIDFHLLYSPQAGTEGALLVKTEQTSYPTVHSWGCPSYL